jgi:DNA-binding transcriptional ArsR family regulator
MQQKAVQTYTIRTPKQIAALKAPTRQEILDVLAPMGEASIAELAAALGRPADALYHHIHILQKVGLVLAVGERLSGTRHEALFRTVAPDLRIAYEPGPKGNAKSVTPIVDAMLRLTSRNFVEGFQNTETVVEGEHRELWATRTTGWLTERQLAEVNRHITALLRTTVTSPPANGRLFALTAVLVPLNRSAARKTSKAPARSGTNQKRQATRAAGQAVLPARRKRGSV